MSLEKVRTKLIDILLSNYGVMGDCLVSVLIDIKVTIIVVDEHLEGTQVLDQFITVEFAIIGDSVHRTSNIGLRLATWQ